MNVFLYPNGQYSLYYKKKKDFKKTKSLTFLNEIFKILSCIRFYDIKHI